MGIDKKGDKIGSLRAISVQTTQLIQVRDRGIKWVGGEWGGDRITSHIFLSLIDNKRVSTMLLLLLVWLVVLVGINNDPDLQAG